MLVSDGIEASHCRFCGRNVIPPRETCPFCPDTKEKTELILMKPIGTIKSHTTLHRPPEGFESHVFLALVELDEGLQALCHVAPELIESIKVDSRVTIGYDSSKRLIVQQIN